MNVCLQLITNPAIISLAAGYIVALCTERMLPALLMNAVSMYLIFAIGYKGGACLGVAHACTPPLFKLTLVGMLIGFIQPFIYYRMINRTTDIDLFTRVVLAAQYGSISIVTFVTAMSFLSQQVVMYDTYMTALAGLMEIPALFSGLWIFKHDLQHASGAQMRKAVYKITKAIITCKKINVIFIGFFVGIVAKQFPTHWLDFSIVTPFSAILVLFMLDIGMKIARQRAALMECSWQLIAFGLYAPLVSGVLSVLVAAWFDISVGSTVLFASLISSASYIAVPAIMQTEIPQAKQAIYMPMALGVTLPFNILVGIPVYYYVSSWLQSGL